MFLARRLLPRASAITRAAGAQRRPQSQLIPAESKLKQISDSNRDLILSILRLTTTRRETNQYLNKYSSSFNSPYNSHTEDPFRVIFIKIRGNLYNFETGTLRRFSRTLDYLQKLGANPIILIDSDYISKYQDINKYNFHQIDNFLFNQFHHFTTLMKSSANQLNFIPVRCSLSNDEASQVSLDKPILNFLETGTIPILFPYIFDHKRSREFIVNSSNYLKLLMDKLLDLNKDKERLSVEKIIFIDELGGIPSIERSNNSHVFINLSQEFDQIVAELHIGHLDINDREIHSQNLKSMHDLITRSPNDITGLITTLDIAVESLNLNPIIYNVLTDRSLVSSSLAPVKFRSNENLTERVTKTTIIKKGFTIHEFTSIDELDHLKFKVLIDDSFKRSINLDHYFSRIKEIVSKIFIVGDYEGVAVITNETSKETGETYPYLDKFAISRQAQGSLGVADIIFNLLRRQYAKDVLIWRSKKVNPVNGWYFQRSSGTFNLENSEFRLFWNSERIFTRDKFKSFIDITRAIEPSWDEN